MKLWAGSPINYALHISELHLVAITLHMADVMILVFGLSALYTTDISLNIFESIWFPRHFSSNSCEHLKKHFSRMHCAQMHDYVSTRSCMRQIFFFNIIQWHVSFVDPYSAKLLGVDRSAQTRRVHIKSPRRHLHTPRNPACSR